MNNQQNILIVRKLFDELYSNDNLSIIDQMFTQDVKLIDPASADFEGGIEAFKQKEAFYANAFPKKHVVINEIFNADGNRVVVYWTCEGINRGDLVDIPATEKNFKMTGISIFKFRDNKICEINQNWDRLQMLEQLGLVKEQMEALHH